MKVLFLYSILFTLFAFTKENITFAGNIDYNNNKECKTIAGFIKDYNNRLPSDYAFNAEYCKLKKPATNPGSRLRNLKGSKIDRDICCYVSILDNLGNWDYFCGKIEVSDYNDNKISERIEELKNNPDYENNNFKNIKIDCFSKKIDFMIKALIISLICLI